MTIDIWVGIDSQLDEARMLLKNSAYRVKHPVDAAEFHRILDELRNQPNNTPTIALSIFFGAVLLAFLSWIVWPYISH